MLTRVNLMWVLLIVAGAFGLYQVKYRVQALQAEVAEITNELDEERENLHVVSAEWAYLNRPERLQYLAKKYGDLNAISSDQVSSVESIPFPERNVAEQAPDAPLVNANFQQEKP